MGRALLILSCPKTLKVKNVRMINMEDCFVIALQATSRLGEELVFEIRPAETAAKFII